jgi:hypothetical protein
MDRTFTCRNGASWHWRTRTWISRFARCSYIGALHEPALGPDERDAPGEVEDGLGTFAQGSKRAGIEDVPLHDLHVEAFERAAVRPRQDPHGPPLHQ